MKKVVIVGVSGQDGTLLSQLMLARGNAVLGIGNGRVDSSQAGWSSQSVDILSFEQVSAIISDFQPQEIYYLAAVHSGSEDGDPQQLELWSASYQVNVLGLLNFLEAMRRYTPKARLFYAASSHVFGFPPGEGQRQDESTPFAPTNIYGITKLHGLLACRYYRATHGLFTSVGILYNHESGLRHSSFLSKRIVRGALDIKHGRASELVVGNRSAVVDWGYAPDYVEAMAKTLAVDTPDDFIMASGVGHTVDEFARVALAAVGVAPGDRVREMPELLKKRHPTLIGNPSKLMERTGWRPTVSFEEMISRLIEWEEKNAER